jgi:hypothetical protein
MSASAIKRGRSAAGTRRYNTASASRRPSGRQGASSGVQPIIATHQVRLVPFAFDPKRNVMK